MTIDYQYIEKMVKALESVGFEATIITHEIQSLASLKELSKDEFLESTFFIKFYKDIYFNGHKASIFINTHKHKDKFSSRLDSITYNVDQKYWRKALVCNDYLREKGIIIKEFFEDHPNINFYEHIELIEQELLNFSKLFEDELYKVVREKIVPAYKEAWSTELKELPLGLPWDEDFEGEYLSLVNKTYGFRPDSSKYRYFIDLIEEIKKKENFFKNCD